MHNKNTHISNINPHIIRCNVLNWLSIYLTLLRLHDRLKGQKPLCLVGWSLRLRLWPLAKTSCIFGVNYAPDSASKFYVMNIFILARYLAAGALLCSNGLQNNRYGSLDTRYVVSAIATHQGGRGGGILIEQNYFAFIILIFSIGIACWLTKIPPSLAFFQRWQWLTNESGPYTNLWSPVRGTPFSILNLPACNHTVWEFYWGLTKLLTF